MKITYYDEYGNVTDVEYDGGHAWVVDRYVIRSKDYVLDGTSTVIFREDRGYLHCN